MYLFQSELARTRWHSEALLWEVNRDLGYPILVLQDSGEYSPAPSAPLDTRFYLSPDLEEQVGLGKAWRVDVRQSLIHGKGVFANAPILKNDLIGTYNGKVLTYEESETTEKVDDHFLFCLNDGANGRRK